jgi:hypothetical protein
MQRQPPIRRAHPQITKNRERATSLFVPELKEWTIS